MAGRKPYRSIELSASDIATGAYKNHFGGGADQWHARGAFQLQLLQTFGLRPHHRLLDIGCGPLRGGVHFIAYLDAGNYCGVDYNPDFIRAAESVVDETGLREKRPRLVVIDNFDFAPLGTGFDYALAYSVLNHCSPGDQDLFFRQIAGPMKSGGKVYVSHGRHVNEPDPGISSIRLTAVYRKSGDNDDGGRNAGVERAAAKEKRGGTIFELTVS